MIGPGLGKPTLVTALSTIVHVDQMTLTNPSVRCNMSVH